MEGPAGDRSLSAVRGSRAPHGMRPGTCPRGPRTGSAHPSGSTGMFWAAAGWSHSARWLESKGTNVGGWLWGVWVGKGRRLEKVGSELRGGRGGWGLCRVMPCCCRACCARYLPSPDRGACFQPPLRLQLPQQWEQAVLLRCRASRLDDSLPPPELHPQALIDACHDAELPKPVAGAQADSVLPCGTPHGLASLAWSPVPKRHNLCGPMGEGTEPA